MSHRQFDHNEERLPTREHVKGLDGRSRHDTVRDHNSLSCAVELIQKCMRCAI